MRIDFGVFFIPPGRDKHEAEKTAFFSFFLSLSLATRYLVLSSLGYERVGGGFFLFFFFRHRDPEERQDNLFGLFFSCSYVKRSNGITAEAPPFFSFFLDTGSSGLFFFFPPESGTTSCRFPFSRAYRDSFSLQGLKENSERARRSLIFFFFPVFGEERAAGL